MIHDAQVNLAGFLAADPQFKRVAGDISTAKLRVAYTSRRRNRDTGEWADGATSFVNVQCWRQLADNVTVCLRKGEPVLVSGRLQIRRYEDGEGRTRSVVEIEANSVGHDLARGVAHFSRIRRPPVSTAAESAGGQATNGPEGSQTEAWAHGAEAAGATGDGATGDGVLDEQAVADFAKELSGSLGSGAPGADGLETGDPQTGGPDSAGAEPVGQETPVGAGV